MRRLPRVVPIALALSLLMQGNAASANLTVVQQLNFVFTPDPVRIRMGDTVRWANRVVFAHTTTDLSKLVLWDSGRMYLNDSFDYVFTSAGTYPYWCTLHARFGMFGTVTVRDEVTPPSGPVGTLFTVAVATVDAPVGLVYDIQKKDPGGTYQYWMVGVTVGSATFDSTGQPTGTYSFRSRLRRLSDNAATQYSPASQITVTGGSA